MKLSDLALWHEALIDGFEDDIEQSHARRLREIGFYEKSKVYCLRRTPFKGPLIFRVGSAVFSIGSDVAAKIHIIPCSVV